MMQHLSISLFVFMPVIFLIYSLSFFMLGITIMIEGLSSAGQGRFKHFVETPLGALSVFGLAYGLYEFIGIFNILYGGLAPAVKITRLLLIFLSFFFLCRFGASYGREPSPLQPDRESPAPAEGGPSNAVPAYFRLRTGWPNLLAGIWIILSLFLLTTEGFGNAWYTSTGIFARYFVGLPGALMASFALARSSRGSSPDSRRYLVAAALGFVFYAAGIFITPKADFYPASVFNHETFYKAMHMPTQVFRTFCAFVITFSMLKFLRLSRDFVSIRFKAVQHVIFAVLIPAFFIILLVSYLMANALLRLSYRENEKLASVIAHRTMALLSETADSVKYNLFLAGINPDTPARNLVESVLMENDKINGIAFFDGREEMLRAEKEGPSQAISFSGIKEVAAAGNMLKALTPVAGQNQFYLGGHDDKNVSLVLPASKGRVEVFLDLKKLYESAVDVAMEKNWHILLVDDKGDIVIHGARGHLTRSAIFESPGLDRATYGRTLEENGAFYNAIQERVGRTGWSVITEIPRSEIVMPVFDVFKGLVPGILLVYLSSVGVATLFIRRVTMPINLIASRVKSIAKEDFASRLQIRTRDEIQILSEEVEKMAVMLVEKKEMEKQMMQTEKIASLGRLVAGVAHEVNTPLGIILGYCEILQHEIGPQDRHQEELGIMRKQVLACKKTVQDLLQFSRTGRQLSILVDINANIEEALSLVFKQFSKGNISIYFRPEPSLPEVLGDPDKLHQVFLNLAVNSLDAMKKGGGSLAIATRSYASGPERLVEVTFSDTGCGIRREDMARIFDPFFTTKEIGEGTGLGLSVSYGIVKDHDGRIWAESAEGKGSTFHVVLPAAAADSQRAGEKDTVESRVDHDS